ncbi:MAG: hypothetical protein WC954_07810 [Sphaerochaeta sp.]
MPESLVYLDEGMKRWIVATAYRNHWRVAAWYDLDDLIQDGYLSYHKCATKYDRLIRKRKPKKEDRRNFMALVKRTFENHIHDLASKRTRQRPEVILSRLRITKVDGDYNESTILERIGGVTDATIAEEVAYFNRMPSWMKKVLRGVIRDVQKGKRVTVEDINARLCRVFGDDEKSVDKVSEVYDILGIVRPRKNKRPNVIRKRQSAMAKTGARTL